VTRHPPCAYASQVALPHPPSLTPPSALRLTASPRRPAPPPTTCTSTTTSAWRPTCRSGSTTPPPTGWRAPPPWVSPRESLHSFATVSLFLTACHCRGYDGLVAVPPQFPSFYHPYYPPSHRPLFCTLKLLFCMKMTLNLQVLGDTQDADFPIFRNNTGKVRCSHLAPTTSLFSTHAAQGHRRHHRKHHRFRPQRRLSEGKLLCHDYNLTCCCCGSAVVVWRVLPATQRRAHSHTSGVRGPQSQDRLRLSHACHAAVDFSSSFIDIILLQTINLLFFIIASTSAPHHIIRAASLSSPPPSSSPPPIIEQQRRASASASSRRRRSHASSVSDLGPALRCMQLLPVYQQEPKLQRASCRVMRHVPVRSQEKEKGQARVRSSF
jgi:hypothetical protein